LSKAYPNPIAGAIGPLGVMAGLFWPPTSFFSLKARKKDVDARDERRHDGSGEYAQI